MKRKKVDPLRELLSAQQRLDRYFSGGGVSDSGLAGSWAPPTDMFESEEYIYLFVDLPGIDEKELRVEVKENVITISGKRLLEERKGESFLQVERSYGPFQRTFRLPKSVNESRVQAEYLLGVLKITMKKDRREEPEFVRVSVSHGK